MNRAALDMEIDQLDPQDIVEHSTIPGFLKTTNKRWHIDEIARFGDKVRKIADSLDLPYVPTMNASLGIIRSYPLPLLQWVYGAMGQQLNWPPIVEAPALDDGKQVTAEVLRSQGRLEKSLRKLLETATNPQARGCAEVLLEWLEAEMERLRAEVGEPATE